MKINPLRWTLHALALAVALAGCPCPPDDPCGTPLARMELQHNELQHNELQAMALHANAAFLARLAQSPLDDTIFTPALPTPRELMTYIVSCALDPGVSVVDSTDLLDPMDQNSGRVYWGGAGLCGDTYNDGRCVKAPRWMDGPPDKRCRELVSACVLARVNAVHRKVVLSTRGDGLTLATAVPVETEYRAPTPDREIYSFTTCPQVGAGGNCGWEARFVGQCTRGLFSDEATATPPSQVTLKVTVHGVATPGLASIRVCKGIYGCDDQASSPAQPPPIYGGERIAEGGDQVTFPCPLNGPKLGPVRTGYYSVMVAPKPGQQLPTGLDVSLVAPNPATATDQYPQDEEHVFTYREGAFFGDIFENPCRDLGTGGDALCQPKAMLTGQQYACFSDGWDHAAAVASSRFCAGPGCFDNEPARCDMGSDPQPSWASVANATDGIGEVAASSSSAPIVYAKAGAWTYPITTYLNHPCDLFPTIADCKALLSADVLSTLPRFP